MAKHVVRAVKTEKNALIKTPSLLAEPEAARTEKKRLLSLIEVRAVSLEQNKERDNGLTF